MINFISINNILTKLEAEYRSSTDASLQQLYSKLAVLELSGWIEVSFDELCQNYVNCKVVETDNKNRIMKIVNKNYGFSYDNNIYPMMCSVLGINNWENILDTFPPLDFNNMKSILLNYSGWRNSAAHTNTTPGVTSTFLAPSAVLVDYNKIKPAFQYLETSFVSLI